jgi:hypothetical protein
VPTRVTYGKQIPAGTKFTECFRNRIMRPVRARASWGLTGIYNDCLCGCDLIPAAATATRSSSDCRHWRSQTDEKANRFWRAYRSSAVLSQRSLAQFGTARAVAFAGCTGRLRLLRHTKTVRTSPHLGIKERLFNRRLQTDCSGCSALHRAPYPHRP